MQLCVMYFVHRHHKPLTRMPKSGWLQIIFSIYLIQLIAIVVVVMIVLMMVIMVIDVVLLDFTIDTEPCV